MTFPEEWIKLAPKPKPLAGTDKWNVFLSYRSVNRSWVLNLYDVLRHQGHQVFLDQCVLKAGDQLIKNLQQGLQDSQAGVLVWSSATRDSDWVEREYEVMERQATSKKGFQFVPLRLDSSELPQFATNRVFLDFSSYPDGPNGGELLRLLHALVGQALSPEAAHFALEQDEAAKSVSSKIGAAVRNGDAERLIQLFNEDGLPWRTSSTLACKAAEGLTKLKRNDDAIKMLLAVEEHFPKAIRPKQLRALDLARRGGPGDLSAAQELLGELYESGERDPETLGIYGRTWMDRFEKSGDINHLRRSRDLYAEAFDGAQDDYYTGINAAAKSVLLGTPKDLDRAVILAQQVQEIVGNQAHSNDYWMTATVGEVLLIQKKYAEAASLYEAAVAMAPSEIGSHETTWKQACRLMQKLEPSAAERTPIRNAFVNLPDCQIAVASKAGN